MKNDEFERPLVKFGGARKNGSGTLYVKNDCDLLRKQVKWLRREDDIFHPERAEHMSEVISPSMTTSFFHKCYEELRKLVMRLFDRLVVWAEKGNEIQTRL